MKKLLLASAVAALSVSAAQAAPTVYGKAFVAADYVNTDFEDYTFEVKNDKGETSSVTVGGDKSATEINSYSSRIGFKGSEALTANTDVVYQLEYGVDIDGDGTTIKNRDTYLGLANEGFGELRFGKNSSTLGFINNVTVTNGYWDNLGTTNLDREKGIAKALNMADEDRINNSVVWLAPKYNGMPLEFALMYGADETFVSDDEDRNAGFGASLMFDQGTGFTAGLAYDKDLEIAGDILRGTVSYDATPVLGMPLTVGGLYQQADYDGSDTDEKGFVVSAEMGLSNFARPASVYAQYNNTTDLNGIKDADSNQVVVGGKYKFTKAATAHAYIGKNAADIQGTDIDVFNIGGGLEYKF